MKTHKNTPWLPLIFTLTLTSVAMADNTVPFWGTLPNSKESYWNPQKENDKGSKWESNIKHQLPAQPKFPQEKPYNMSPNVYKLIDVGGVNGGGGGTPCSELAELIKKVGLGTQELIATKIISVNDPTGINEAIETLSARFRCLPAERLDREARSNPFNSTTRLLTPAWEAKNIQQKIRLAAHEFCIFLGLEREGEYQNSLLLIKAIQQSTTHLKDYQYAENVVRNRDNSATFVRPFIIDEAGDVFPVYIESTKDKRALSLCKHFGYSRVVEVWTASASGTLAVMDNKGVGYISTFREMRPSQDPLAIESVVCK